MVIPEAVIEDASIDLWAEVTPRLGEAIGYAIDSAVFAGTNKPASWPAAIIPAATAAGHVATGTAAIPDQTDFNEAMGFVEMDGYMPSDVYSAVAMRAGFRGWTVNGIPVYLSDYRDDGRWTRCMASRSGTTGRAPSAPQPTRPSRSWGMRKRRSSEFAPTSSTRS